MTNLNIQRSIVSIDILNTGVTPGDELSRQTEVGLGSPESTIDNSSHFLGSGTGPSDECSRQTAMDLGDGDRQVYAPIPGFSVSMSNPGAMQKMEIGTSLDKPGGINKFTNSNGQVKDPTKRCDGSFIFSEPDNSSESERIERRYVISSKRGSIPDDFESERIERTYVTSSKRGSIPDNFESECIEKLGYLFNSSSNTDKLLDQLDVEAFILTNSSNNADKLLDQLDFETYTFTVMKIQRERLDSKNTAAKLLGQLALDQPDDDNFRAKVEQKVNELETSNCGETYFKKSVFSKKDQLNSSLDSGTRDFLERYTSVGDNNHYEEKFSQCIEFVEQVEISFSKRGENGNSSILDALENARKEAKRKFHQSVVSIILLVHSNHYQVDSEHSNHYQVDSECSNRMSL